MTFYIETKEARKRFESILATGDGAFTDRQIGLLGEAFDQGIKALVVNITQEVVELHEVG